MFAIVALRGMRLPRARRASAIQPPRVRTATPAE